MLEAKETQKIISMDKLCGQAVWRNRFSVRKLTSCKNRMMCIFRNWSISRSYVSWISTTSQKKPKPNQNKQTKTQIVGLATCFYNFCFH